MKRLLSIFLACILAALFYLPCMADSVTDTIGIYVGYYGWDAEDYVLKAEYNWYDLDDLYGGCLDTDTYFYSNYSSHSSEGGRLFLTEARGFQIRDLLEMGGIDFQSIARVDFFTKDVDGLNAWCSLTKYQLFDQPRYYFPNLSAKEDSGELFAWDGDDIWNGATTVPSILALESYSEWAEPDETGVELCGSIFENTVTPEMMGPGNRFLLMFGQYDPTDSHTYNLAKYVYRINVTFSGTPVLSADETNIELKVGSAQKLEISVDAEDELLNDFVSRNITWSSSDSSVVQVAPDGTVTVVGDGTAEITATFENSSVTFTVGTGDAPTDGGGGNGGDGASVSAGTGESSVVPAEASPAETAEVPEVTVPPAEAENEIEIPEEEIPAEIPEGKNIITISPDALTALFPQKDASPEASGGAKDDDSEQLILLEQDKTVPYILPVLLTIAAAFLGGFIFEIVRYRRLLVPKSSHKGRKGEK